MEIASAEGTPQNEALRATAQAEIAVAEANVVKHEAAAKEAEIIIKTNAVKEMTVLLIFFNFFIILN